jgi:transcriptional regulator with GAF, ATPase, and Fis domain
MRQKLRTRDVYDAAEDRDIDAFRRAWGEPFNPRVELESGETSAGVRVIPDLTEYQLANLVLEERLRFEKLLADLSTAFVNAPSERLDEMIDGALRALVKCLGNDRSTLVKLTADTTHVVVTHSYAVPGCETFPLGLVADQRLPWFIGQFRCGRLVFLPRIPEDLPLEADLERRYCEVHGVKSNVAIPLKASGSVLGALTFAFLKRRCDWPVEIISRLQLIAEVFANALLRRRSDDALRDALAENEALRARLERENLYLREQVVLKHSHGRIIGQSDSLKKVLSAAERVAVTDAPVLLLGETGTGKELLAQTIHELSARKDRPMVIVNCASLPATLIESELFGREAGAYTGAVSAQVGRFVVADGSTLFLDEIGEFPVELQAKLLRVLQDGRFERLGSPKTMTVNVRIIAATNRDLAQAMRDGKFRDDLYHRLNVFPIHIPPLRERREDIPLLAWAIVEAIGRRMGKTIKSIPRKTIEELQRYNWPGNVRELSNVIERGMILATGDTLHVELPFGRQPNAASQMTLKESEQAQIMRTLDETRWRIRGAGGAAEILGIKPTTLEARMAKLGIQREKRNSNLS